MAPAENFRQSMRWPGCEHRDGKDSAPDNPEREEEARRVSGKRPQRLRRLRGSDDMPLSRVEHCSCRAQNDEIHDQIGEEHSGVYVPGCRTKLLGRITSDDCFFFYSLARFPEI